MTFDSVRVLSRREVRCLTASHQRLLHTGYVPRTQDVHDLQLLDTLEQATPAEPVACAEARPSAMHRPPVRGATVVMHYFEVSRAEQRRRLD